MERFAVRQQLKLFVGRLRLLDVVRRVGRVGRVRKIISLNFQISILSFHLSPFTYHLPPTTHHPSHRQSLLGSSILLNKYLTLFKLRDNFLSVLKNLFCVRKVNDMKNKIKQAAEYILSKITEKPTVAVVLGSGLGDFADTLENAVVIKYTDIPHFPASTVKGHAGRLVIGKKSGKVVVAMQGRFHFYEGHNMQTVTFAMRVMHAIGADDVIVTNAAGGLNPKYKVGSLMLMTDHINFMGTNPLIGPNDEELGVRFPAIQGIYNKGLIEEAEKVGKEIGAPIEKGVYIAVTGPSYETGAELRAFRILGADAVGMSTVPEVIVAAHCGVKRVLGISLITNIATGETETKATHAEVVEAADKAKVYFIKLVETMIGRM